MISDDLFFTFSVRNLSRQTIPICTKLVSLWIIQNLSFLNFDEVPKPNHDEQKQSV